MSAEDDVLGFDEFRLAVFIHAMHRKNVLARSIPTMIMLMTPPW